MKKVYNIIFIGIIVAFVSAGLVSTLFFPKDINYLENRSANKLGGLTRESVMDGTFQDRTSSAFSDQVPMAIQMKKIYNYSKAYFEDKILTAAVKGDTHQYMSYMGGLLFEDHIVYSMKDVDEEQLVKKAENIRKIAGNHESATVYVYYIERDCDIDFATNTKSGYAEILANELAGTGVAFEKFSINNFEEFAEAFYHTDHHWNYKGAYRAYSELIDFMKPEDTGNKVAIKEEKLLDYDFSGSKATTIGANMYITEKFPVYVLDYPEMEVIIDTSLTEDYGAQDKYIEGTTEAISYGAFYGGDFAQISFNTYQPDKENILIIGESFDNAILKLLASHFNRTYSIDLRHYEATYGYPFNYSEYVKANEIDKVLLIGNVDYFIMEEFMLED